MRAGRAAIILLAPFVLATCVDFDRAEKTCEDGGRCALDCCIDPSLCGPLNLLHSTGDPKPQGIAVYGSAIFWVNDDGTLFRSALDGSGAVPLATGREAGRHLIVDSTLVSWVGSLSDGSDGGVYQCLLDGGSKVEIVHDDIDFGPLVESNGTLYWMQNRKPHALPPGGGAPFSAWQSNSGFGTVLAMAADSDNLYLGQAGMANRVGSTTKNGGMVITLPTPNAVHVVEDLTFDGTHLIWLDEPAADAGFFGVYSMLTDGGEFTQLAAVPITGMQRPQSIAVDDAGIYWTVGGGGKLAGRLMMLDAAGGAPRCLQSALSSPYRLAVDGQSVYWTDTTQGAVFSTPKR